MKKRFICYINDHDDNDDKDILAKIKNKKRIHLLFLFFFLFCECPFIHLEKSLFFVCFCLFAKALLDKDKNEPFIRAFPPVFKQKLNLTCYLNFFKVN